MSNSQDLVTLAQSVVDQARRLGILWTIRFATVVDGSDVGHVSVIFDGPADALASTADSTARDLVSIIGPLSAGQRVTVATVPPSGQYVIGLPTKRAANYGEKVGWISLQSNSVGVVGTTPVAVLSSPIDADPAYLRIKLAGGTAYRVRASGGHFSSAVGLLDALNFWVGAVGSGEVIFLGNLRAEGGASAKYYTEQVFRCLSDTEDDYFLASNCTTAGTVTQFASSTNSRYLEVAVLGPNDDWPDTPTIG